MASIIRQFALLAWKNWLLTKRRPIATTFELLLPLIMPSVMLVLRPFVSATVSDTPTHYPPFFVDRLPTNLLPPLLRYPDEPAPPHLTNYRNIWLVAYAPNNTIVSRVVNIATMAFNSLLLPTMNTSVPYYRAHGKILFCLCLLTTCLSFLQLFFQCFYFR